MLQQDTPEDYVIATGKQYSVRDFITWAAEDLGVTLAFSGEGIEEVGKVTGITGDNAPGLSVGDVIVKVDRRYFRPAEVETLLGDPAKAKANLGWEPEISARVMCAEMVSADLAAAQRHAFLKAHGHDVAVSVEDSH